ncbi:energy-coupling factor transporter transmembrane component T [Exiguobacterium sp. 17-1]|uniref:energy-coupling factor transporter transmembrane component T family protein n=1 Tax=Exiguobacterium sp. 17-1 TaxID=2931981 RepID=UPI001FFE4E3F|nr:energy-coupling factor transporter transmembrane component T [Exiguobacterium sp. 17-1]MCK2158264.1 energy-coupling factor transporter transmembrane protein EcfT [Exiguobacterium sp. 17-1]
MAVDMLGYIERKSPVHRLTGATKLICFLLWTIATIVTYDTRVLIVLLLASVGLFSVSKISFKEVRFVLLFTLSFILLNSIAVYLFAPEQGVAIYGTRHVLAEGIGRFTVTSEQLFYLLNLILKYSAIVPIAVLFLVTTHPTEFAASLNRIGIPYKIAFAVSLALRYIPDVQRDFRTIKDAQEARGVALSNAPLFKRIRNSLNILLPLVFTSLERIETVSNAMDLRGFGAGKKRTWYNQRPMTKADFTAIACVGLLVLLSCFITFYDGNRFYNPFR